MATSGQMTACDYVGIVSGKNTPDKMEKAGFHTTKAEFVDAPVIEELPMTLECRLISYDPESCHLFGEIVNVSADESILTDGKIDIKKLSPITFDPVGNAYHVIGEKVGNAFHDGAELKKITKRNSSAFRLHCYKCMHTGCDFRSLAPANLGITLRMQRDLHSVSVGANRVPLAHSALAGYWKAEL